MEDMMNVKLVEKLVVLPETPTSRRRLFLSNIDLTLVAYYETVSFFDPPTSDIKFSEVCRSLYRALSRILVVYDFLAGRIEPAAAQGMNDRLEIDCNGAGVVVVAATTSSEMSQLGELRAPKPAFKQLVSFLHGEDERTLELREKPLLLLQLTRFQCGGLALGSLSNHCTLDGIAIRDFVINLSSLTRGEDLVIIPNPDRTFFKSRNPPRITHPHFEYSTPINSDISFSIRGTCGYTTKQPLNPTLNHLVYISPERIASLKSMALKDGQLTSCTTFHVVATKIWKARSIAMELPDECTSTMLFPVDVRQRMAPNAPHGFAGNAVVPGYARSSVRKLKNDEFSFFVGEVQKGVERLDDDYVRSGIDWLEVHKGVPCRDDSFSVVAWWRLGLEGQEYWWGKVKFVAPVEIKPGLVILLPGDKDEGGINICLELPSEQMKEFYKLMMED